MEVATLETVSPRKTLKSYLSEEQRMEILREGDFKGLYLEESSAASKAGDFDSAWAWMAKVELSATNLMRLKWNHGADFIRYWGFKTRNADAAYGEGWLDKEYQP